VEAISQEIHDLVFVLNKADRADAEERSAALEFSRRGHRNSPETTGIQNL
jgi:putative protein kinase ArgK-like GTPase of G3E family